MKRLLVWAVLAVAFSASLPAQNTGTVGTPASFKDEAKAELAVELIKKYEGLHDRSDYPYYGYGHCKLNIDIFLTLYINFCYIKLG